MGAGERTDIWALGHSLGLVFQHHIWPISLKRETRKPDLSVTSSLKICFWICACRESCVPGKKINAETITFFMKHLYLTVYITG